MAKTTTTTAVDIKTRHNARLAWLDREIKETTHMIASLQRTLNGLEDERDFLVSSLAEHIED